MSMPETERDFILDGLNLSIGIGTSHQSTISNSYFGTCLSENEFNFSTKMRLEIYSKILNAFECFWLCIWVIFHSIGDNGTGQQSSKST